MTGPIDTHLEIRRIPRVRTRGVVEAVLFPEWVVVRASRREWRSACRFTATNGVEVDAVRAGCETHGSHIDVHYAVVALPKLRGTDAVAADVGERCSRGSHLVAAEKSRRTSTNRCNRCYRANRFECSHSLSGVGANS
jgi:hypothetical protein